MPTLTVGQSGEVTLPSEIREHYGLRPETPVRLIETRHGILLIPLTDAPMAPGLAAELAEWQDLGSSTWEAFPYEDRP